MKMPLLATLFVHAESSSASDTPRLRDLIIGLHAGDIPAVSVLDRLDPAFADEIRAFVAHRGLNAENFLANALLAFALDAADRSWQRATQARQTHAADPEADLITDLLADILRQRLDREVRLGWPAAAHESHVTFARRRG